MIGFLGEIKVYLISTLENERELGKLRQWFNSGGKNTFIKSVRFLSNQDGRNRE